MRKRKVDASEESVWSAIPHDILHLLCEKLRFLEDFVRFFAVCRCWYSFGSVHYKNLKFAPLFLVREDPRSSTTQRTLKNHLSGNDFVFHLPEAAGRRCWGSPFGWIVTFRALDLELTLLNPFSRASIALPSLRTLIPGIQDHYNPNERLIKAILTATPDSVDCLVVLMIRPSASESGSMVGFARPGRCDEGWSQFEGCPSDLNDVVWFRGSLYGSRRNSLEVVLIEPPRATQFAVLPRELAREQLFRCGWDRVVEGSEFKSVQYVVDWGGNLCLVLRYLNDNTSYHFKVFRIDLATKKWTRVWPSTGDQCLFIGNNYSFAYTCSESVASPSSNHFKANMIYYTNDDDLAARGPNEGIFNTLICRPVEITLKDFNINPSLWIAPRLHFSRLVCPKNKNKLQRCSHSIGNTR